MRRRELLSALPFAFTFACNREEAFQDRYKRVVASAPKVTVDGYRYFLSLENPGLVDDHGPFTADVGTDYDFAKRIVRHNGYVGTFHDFFPDFSKQSNSKLFDKNGQRITHDIEQNFPEEHLKTDREILDKIAVAVLVYIEEEKKSGKILPAIFGDHKRIFTAYLEERKNPKPASLSPAQ